MANRHNVYNETLTYIKEKEKNCEILVIQPEQALEISRVEKNPDKLLEVYEIGRKAAFVRIDAIKSFLDKG